MLNTINGMKKLVNPLGDLIVYFLMRLQRFLIWSKFQMCDSSQFVSGERTGGVSRQSHTLINLNMAWTLAVVVCLVSKSRQSNTKSLILFYRLIQTVCVKTVNVTLLTSHFALADFDNDRQSFPFFR